MKPMADKEIAAFWEEFGAGRTMVLSTALHDEVTSRMMSVVAIGGRLFFQTDCSSRKYPQLIGNPKVALCTDNIQIEGLAFEEGTPAQNEAFTATYRACFPGSFDSYSALADERIFSVTPMRIERWKYLAGKPYLEVMDLTNGNYRLDACQCL